MTIRKLFALALCLLPVFAIAQAGSWQLNQSIGGFNQVHVYTPASQLPLGDGRALLVVLHGCTQSIDAYLNANLETAAEEHGMVVAVPDAVNKAGFGCWSYWQGAISRNSGDYARLVNLASSLTNDASFAIDPNQVYIAGLSSGATFAAQAACTAPDIFAGVAPSAGPTIGTSSSGAIGPCETVSPAQFESRCRSYAGSSFQSYFDTQVAVVGHGTSVTTVNTCYNQQNAKGYARLFGVAPLACTNTIVEGSGSAEETLWEDGRVAMLWFDNLAHVWSGGPGASGSFIGGNSINFASYLGEFFAANNPRINRNQPPSVDALAVAAVDSTLLIEGIASDADGTVDVVLVSISNIDAAPVLVSSFSTPVDIDGNFSISSNDLADGLYEVSAVAVDDQGAESVAESEQARIGPPPPEQPPVISDVDVSINGQCATVSGVVTDPNQNLDSVSVTFFGPVGQIGTSPAEIDGVLFAASRCELPGGTVEATATAIDTTNLSSSAVIEFEIDAGQTGDFNFHIAQGHITWGSGYAACYLAFGTNSFTMRETSASGGQCRWVADDNASCQGPIQACSQSEPVQPPPEPEPEPEPSCISRTAMNYLHRSAGRAYSSGFFWAPDYFAEGSNDPMPGSTYGTNTLYSLDDGNVWKVGNCPTA